MSSYSLLSSLSLSLFRFTIRDASERTAITSHLNLQSPPPFLFFRSSSLLLTQCFCSRLALLSSSLLACLPLRLLASEVSEGNSDSRQNPIRHACVSLASSSVSHSLSSTLFIQISLHLDSPLAIKLFAVSSRVFTNRFPVRIHVFPPPVAVFVKPLLRKTRGMSTGAHEYAAIARYAYTHDGDRWEERE